MLDKTLTDVIIFLSGLFSGLFVAIAAGTAGAIMLPCLTVIAGISIYQAIGASLLMDCIIGLSAGIVFFTMGHVDFKPIVFLGSTGIVFAFIGSQFTAGTPQFYLTIIVGIILFVLGINFIINGVRKNLEFFQSKLKFKTVRKNKIPFYILFGVVVGFLSGFFGMGSAGLVAIILVLVFDFDIHTGIGTSLFMMFFIAGAGGIGHALAGEYVLMPLIIGGVGAGIGAIIGSVFSNKFNEEKLGRMIGVIVSLFGIIFIVKSFF